MLMLTSRGTKGVRAGVVHDGRERAHLLLCVGGAPRAPNVMDVIPSNLEVVPPWMLVDDEDDDVLA